MLDGLKDTRMTGLPCQENSVMISSANITHQRDNMADRWINIGQWQ